MKAKPTSPIEVANTRDQLLEARRAGLPDIAICPRHLPSCSRNGSTYRNGWKVYRPGYNIARVDPATGKRERGPITGYDDNCRVFDENSFRTLASTWQEERHAAFLAAQTWASARYRVGDWVRNRHGDYADARVNKLFPIRRSS